MRNVLSNDKAKTLEPEFQKVLATLIHTSLLLRQTHWNIRGAGFKPVHEQLDEILETVAGAVDDVAERIVTLGFPAIGGLEKVTELTALDGIDQGFMSTSHGVEAISDRLLKCSQVLRGAIDVSGDIDPISEDLFISITADIEKHLWLLQSENLSA